MNKILKKNDVEISVKEKGAELVSVKIKGKEFIWNKEKVWAKSSPILFPFIGQLLDNKYIYDNKEYIINTRHGFARDMIFNIVQEGDNVLKCTLNYTDETLKIYPFKFILEVVYEILDNNSISMKFIVYNKDEKAMYFSVGSHPAFLLEDDFSSYYLQIEDKKDLEYYELEGLRYPNKKLSLGVSDRINIDDEIFKKNDTLIFDGNISNKTIIKSDKYTRSVEITHKNYPYLAYWKALKVPFICVESWYGITDLKDHNYKLEHKKGIEKLEVAKNFEASLIFSFKE